MKLSLRLISDPSRTVRNQLERILNSAPGLFDAVEDEPPARRTHQGHRGPDQNVRKPHGDPLTIEECILALKGWEVTASEVVELARSRFACELKLCSVSAVLSSLASQGKIKKTFKNPKGEHRYFI